METARTLFESGLEHCTTIPDSLQPSFVGGKTPDQRALAERLIRALLAQPKYETLFTTLLNNISTAIAQDAFAANAIDIADTALGLLGELLCEPSLNRLFDKTTALVTIYFFVVFVMVCAGADAREVTKHENSLVRIALLANRLLLNRQIYENTIASVVRRFAKMGCCCGGGSTAATEARAEMSV